MELQQEALRIFDLFQNQWAIVTAGTLEDHNGCTVSWGSMGTIWTRSNHDGSTVTVYIHPARHTLKYLEKYDTFTVNFFEPSHKKALAYMGSHSGKDEDKEAMASLHPRCMGQSVSYQEASLSFLCRKMYLAQLDKDALHQEIQTYYKENPKAYPVDEEGDWQPHFLLMGEIIAYEKK